MMNHISGHNWSDPEDQSDVFVEESALNNCTIEKLLRGKFRDPMQSSDEDQEPPMPINWDALFKPKNPKNGPCGYVPGMRTAAAYPKLSVLSGLQHFQCLKVICPNYPHVLRNLFIKRPTAADIQTYGEVLEAYKREQKEYIEWAKSQWVNHHCVRALRPKPMIETVYEAEFRLRAHRLKNYPKDFDMAAQIPLECTRPFKYEITLQGVLVGVNIKDLPHVQLPQLQSETTVIQPCAAPEPCRRHPSQFILPKQDNLSELPLADVHQEMAQFAADHNAKYIASENALKCLTEFSRHWTLPVTVCSAVTPGDKACAVVVLGSEFCVRREPAATRTYRAYRHLLDRALIPPSARDRPLPRSPSARCSRRQPPPVEPDLSSDEDTPGLCIFEDLEEDDDANESYLEDVVEMKPVGKSVRKRHFKEIAQEKGKKSHVDAFMEDIHERDCTCTALPPRRSFCKWRVANKAKAQESLSVIVHCSHKAKIRSTELYLEPIPEYQLELGASQQSPDRVRSLMLSLILRQNVAALNVRLDGCDGSIVTVEQVAADQFMEAHPAEREQVLNVLHTTLSELEGLLPGYYVLQHEPCHGANTLLLVARPDSNSLHLNFDSSQLLDPDEAKTVKIPPTITNELLPYHKARKILPCAFPPHKYLLAKEKRRPAARNAQPPQAIKWKKKRNKKKNKK